MRCRPVRRRRERWRGWLLQLRRWRWNRESRFDLDRVHRRRGRGCRIVRCTKRTASSLATSATAGVRVFHAVRVLVGDGLTLTRHLDARATARDIAKGARLRGRIRRRGCVTRKSARGLRSTGPARFDVPHNAEMGRCSVGTERLGPNESLGIDDGTGCVVSSQGRVRRERLRVTIAGRKTSYRAHVLPCESQDQCRSREQRESFVD